MKRIGSLFLVSLIFILSCGSAPKPVETPPPVETAEPQAPVPVSVPEPVPEPIPEPEPPPQIAEAPVEEKVFDPQSISEEKFETTKADVQTLINDLNRIIRAKNYNAWVSFLADCYLEEITSKDFLEERTEELFKRDQIVASNMGRDPRRVQKKILRTAKDYFDNVVVPSRSNDPRVDDIDFKDENLVTAYTVNNRGDRRILYNLELIDNHWKIIN